MFSAPGAHSHSLVCGLSILKASNSMSDPSHASNLSEFSHHELEKTSALKGHVIRSGPYGAEKISVF